MATDSIPNRGPEVLAATTITWALAVIATGLRVLSRKLKRNRLWLDDWLAIACHHFTVLNQKLTTFLEVPRGFGKHIYDGPPDAAYAWALGLFIGELAYFSGLVLIKWAILAFYWRIFNILHSIRLRIWTLFAIVSAWGLASILVMSLKCQPVDSNWVHQPNSTSEYHSLCNDRSFFYGNVIPNMITDILLIAFPAPYIAKTQLSMARKLGLATISLFRALVVLISAVLFFYTLRMDLTSPDVTWNYVDTSMWSVVEQNLAVVCACLPSLMPLFVLATNGTLCGRSNFARGSIGLSRARNNTVGSQLRTLPKNWKVGTPYRGWVSDFPSGSPQEGRRRYRRVSVFVADREQFGP
ncbi:uncharacterized protein TRIVIDRAFT_53608 [Trichoderma virens Gv29-8]|uniref:Rhodopsin domain-containing protein n=1 Tax=Hypocrea virens (strain Gv29-8 / FGSC 10586) TaxID=413071 RepID=G9MUB2_HYPVG|nr:uncharacterized protein TRIVIDRAFT_53608 [Trichoderma virens Gv29-8]EHK21962.1 hypothetical protein TRIVIDRAFT_53608 [Trichoderma virens Gv29-8]